MEAVVQQTPRLCYVASDPPPSKAATVHDQMLDSLDDILAGEGRRLQEGRSGPCLLTIVNASRILADINRETNNLRGEILYLKKLKK